MRAIIGPFLSVLTGVAAQLASAEPWQAEVSVTPRIAAAIEDKALPPIENWGARIEYGIAADTAFATKQFASGDERGWSKAVFATLHRRFPGRDSTPYIGVGAGYAEGMVTVPSEVAEGALAFKGVIGTEVTLDEGLGAFAEYSFAVSPGASIGPGGSLRSHALTTGLTLDLN